MILHVRVFDKVEELSRGAAEATARALEEAIGARGSASLVLAGGGTPRPVYRLLASRLADRIDWARVHVFWGDERFVPPDDPQSNYRMAREMLLNHVPCPAENIHPMQTHHANPDTAAREYEITLRTFFGDSSPRFDLVHLGVGSDGHSASLFPGSSILEEKTRWVVPAVAPDRSPRLTLTLPALTGALHTYFIVTGSDKAQAVRTVLGDPAGDGGLPAARVRPVDGEVTWWLDREAAGRDIRAHDGTGARQEE